VLASGAVLAAAASLAMPASATTSISAHGAHNGLPRSSGCGSPAAAGTTTEMLNVAGAPRQYRLAVPAEPTGKRRLPLILNFHGAGGTDVQQARYSQLEEKGAARDFVVVTPNAGDPPLWNRLDTNSNFVEPSEANMAFTGAIIDAVAERLCIDKHRIYATGHSNGAGMSAYLGCTSKPPLAAIAPVAGINLAKPCPHGTPLSVIAFHGTADASVGYAGGQGAIANRPDK
jgi:polyhydroxybutyrate depolymerase